MIGSVSFFKISKISLVFEMIDFGENKENLYKAFDKIFCFLKDFKIPFVKIPFGSPNDLTNLTINSQRNFF